LKVVWTVLAPVELRFGAYLPSSRRFSHRM
jgi:hypothetical protein